MSAETRARVLAAAEQLHYTVDKNASGLRRRRSKTLAVLFFEEGYEEGTLNSFYLSMIGPMVRKCAEHGYDLLISSQQISADFHLDFEDSHKADGIILLGYGNYLQYEPKLLQLIDRGAHFVRWGSAGQSQLGLTVSSDNEQGGFDATAHLLEQGRRKIAFVGTVDPAYPEFLERWNGYCRALRAAGIECHDALRASAKPSEESGRKAAAGLIDKGIEFDAVFAACDLAAIGVMHVLQELGRRIPEDVSVVGFDDIPAARLTSPPLTTVRQDARLAGEALVESILEAVENDKAANRVLPAQLMIRASSMRD